MKGKMRILIAVILPAAVVLFSNSQAMDAWKAPFDTTVSSSKPADSTLSLDDALRLVATENPAFRSFSFLLEAANNDLAQAGLWSNPELESEFEEVGWSAPGFRESEFSISIAQEFEFFGQRAARKNVARAQIDATKLQVRLSTFDLYLETKQRFYALAHAQQKVILSEKSIELAGEIVRKTNYRLERGAGLQSEILLARLEEQRAQLALDQARQDVIAEEATLVSLWKGKPSGVKVSTETGVDFSHLLDRISELTNQTNSSREVVQLQSGLEILKAEKRLTIATARPAITLSGGFKRLAVDNSKSFLFGVSLPIPFFNRNQGTKASLTAQLRSLEYDLERNRIESNSNIQAYTIRLMMLVNSYATLDSLLLPTAEKAYRTLQNAYEAGRVPYTQLLEAERALNDINFERNDILLSIQEQIIELESHTGLALQIKKEN